ncbi:MAG TPA: hypothetical protein VM243_17965 [Phycisphaerae bacterium]|nr:hypothetical protein [Phycisphaerae bacterium]
MPRRLRIDRGGIAYHVLNRRVGREGSVWPEADGYDEFVRGLPRYLDGVRADWYEDLLADCDWHSERIVYRRGESHEVVDLRRSGQSANVTSRSSWR